MPIDPQPLLTIERQRRLDLGAAPPPGPIKEGYPACTRWHAHRRASTYVHACTLNAYIDVSRLFFSRHVHRMCHTIRLCTQEVYLYTRVFIGHQEPLPLWPFRLPYPCVRLSSCPSLAPICIGTYVPLEYVYMYTRVNMVIHHHRRRYVNKLDLSSVAGRRDARGSSMGTVPKEGRTRRECAIKKRKERQRGGAREIMRKRLSSHTHDPGDRIQIYWFLAYTSVIGREGGGEDRERNRVRRAVWCERKPGILRSWFRSNVRLDFVLPRAINLPAIRKCAYSSIDEENDAVADTCVSFHQQFQSPCG